LDFNSKALEVRAISISTSKGCIILIVCYRALVIEKQHYSREWQTFINFIIKNGNKFLIGGDLNAHHFSWGSNCHNGNIIYLIYIYIYIFIDPDQFVILNNGNTTHVIGPNFFNS